MLVLWQRLATIFYAFLLISCGASYPEEGPCKEASQRMGVLACVHSIPDRDRWDEISVPAGAVDQLSTTKYLMPAQSNDPLEPLFINVNEVMLHYDLLSQGFPDLFPGITQVEYIDLVTSGPERPYFAGNLTEYIDRSDTFYGFTVWDDPSNMDVVVQYEQVLFVYRELKRRVGLSPLVFVPHSTAQRDAAETWDPAFPIRGVDTNVVYEPYTQAVGYGIVQRYTMEQFQEATERVAFGYQNILVLEDAPIDIERVISGAVTGTRQGELSHINVRSAARGTPNCFVADALETFASWEGTLVRFECGADDWTITEATIEDAEAWWDALRPEPVTLPPANITETNLMPLLELPSETISERQAAAATFGSKGANLGTLYQRIPETYQLNGFLIPFAWYQAFMDTQSWTVDIGNGPESLSFSDTIQAWLDDPTFTTNGALRRSRLEALRDAIRTTRPSEVLIAAIEEAIIDTYGTTTTMVRFRSSSNAEDALAFSGAGLYDSTSACLADERDDNTTGPSLCDPEKSSERSIERALTKVWASMWKMEAFEERAWYGIPHLDAKMGILVNTRSKNEQANVVAFTGNPTAPDDRMLINAQIGELDVVSSEPGVIPEKTLLDFEANRVSDIIRVHESSELDGEWVLSEALLTELGELFLDIESIYPIDEMPPSTHTRLLDTEWKVLSDGTLIIKQIRPFLRQNPVDDADSN